MEEIDFGIVERELERIIKKQIKDEGLVKTGTLLDSIKVSYKDGVFSVTAEDYYKFLDEEHNLSQGAIDSIEFLAFFEKFLIGEFEKKINTFK